MTKLILLFAFLFSSVGLSKEIEYKHIVLNFDQGQTKLNDGQKTKLKNFVSNIHANARVTDIEVAVWADKERETSEALSKEDQELAKERGEYIKRDIDLAMKSDKSVKVFNMAKTANIGSRIIRSKRAKIDPTYDTRAANRPITEDVALMKSNGGASKAVAVIEFKPRLSE